MGKLFKIGLLVIGVVLLLGGAKSCVSCDTSNSSDFLRNGKTLNETVANKSGQVEYTLQGNYTIATQEGAKTELGGDGIENITFKGNANGATIAVTGEANESAIQAKDSATLTFQNITFKNETPAGDNWVQWALDFGGNLVFKNCNFLNVIMIKNDANARFINCNFQSDVSGRYSVWIWDGAAYFENCTFTGYRGLKIHEEFGTDVLRVEVKNCLFNELSEKPGLVIGGITIDPQKTTVYIHDSRFVDCQAWDIVGSLEGLDGAYETDTLTEAFDFVWSENEVVYGDEQDK